MFLCPHKTIYIKLTVLVRCATPKQNILSPLSYGIIRNPSWVFIDYTRMYKDYFWVILVMMKESVKRTRIIKLFE